VKPFAALTRTRACADSVDVLLIRNRDTADGINKRSKLIRARAYVARSDGWHTDRIDAWSQDGAYLGSAKQLRLVAQ
jgi:hypothetical protein